MNATAVYYRLSKLRFHGQDVYFFWRPKPCALGLCSRVDFLMSDLHTEALSFIPTLCLKQIVTLLQLGVVTDTLKLDFVILSPTFLPVILVRGRRSEFVWQEKSNSHRMLAPIRHALHFVQFKSSSISRLISASTHPRLTTSRTLDLSVSLVDTYIQQSTSSTGIVLQENGDDGDSETCWTSMWK